MDGNGPVGPDGQAGHELGPCVPADDEGVGGRVDPVTGGWQLDPELRHPATG